ncbi:MAG TPA: glycoside hydrolase family 2 protein, partial [Pseudonocardiaceae bacterium]
WMSNPAWHSTVWQTYDYDLDVNGSYYGSRKGCEPHHVQADLSSWQVTALNHTPTPLTGANVSAQLYDLTGNNLGMSQQANVNIPTSNASPVFVVPFDPSLPALHLLRLTMTDSKGTVLSENTYWRYRADTDMQALNQVPTTQVSGSLSQHGGTYSTTLRNTGTSVAAMIRLSLRTDNGNTRVLPTLYSDNYFWLLPGESKQVTISPRVSAHGASLLVEGYNISNTTVH